MVVVIPVLPEQVNAIPANVIGSPALNPWFVSVKTVAIPEGSSYVTEDIIPTPCWVPSTNILSLTFGSFLILIYHQLI